MKTMEKNNQNIGKLLSDCYGSAKQELKVIFYDILCFPAGFSYSSKNTIETKLK
jgi:hypothetical protein